jgi:hypothetical protein
MFDPAKSLRGVLYASMMGVIGVGCSGNGTTTSYSSGSGANGSSNGLGGPTPGTLVSTCDQICSNVVARCVDSPANVYTDCISACGALNLVQGSCLDPFASYLACMAGATSVTCGGDGQYVLITPQECEADREATLNCNAAPGLIAACVGVPSNQCGASDTNGQTTGEAAVFCVGAPAGCAPPEPNPLGIGVYCCSN